MLGELSACGLGPDAVDALWEAYQLAREEEEAMGQAAAAGGGGPLGGSSGGGNKENQQGGVSWHSRRAGSPLGQGALHAGLAAEVPCSSGLLDRGGCRARCAAHAARRPRPDPRPPACARRNPLPQESAATGPKTGAAVRVGAMALGVMSRLIQVVRMLHQVCVCVGVWDWVCG